MALTKHELTIRACQFAVLNLIQKGSHAFGTKENGKFETIEWGEVLEWLDNELIKAEKMREY